MRAIDFFFALRPLVLVPAWSFFLIGHGAFGGNEPLPLRRLLLFTLSMCGVYLVNQVVDFESDRINGKGLFLQRGVFDRPTYRTAAMLAIGMALAGALVWRESPGLLALATALGLAYSVPPLRWSARPGLDLAANAIGYGAIAPSLGSAPGAWRDPAAAPLLASTLLAVGAVFLHTTLLDLEGDRRTHKRTSGVWLGPLRSRVLAAAMAVGAAVLAALQPWAPLLAAAGLTAGLALAAALRPRRISSRTVCVAATAVYALAAGLAWPTFLLWVAGLAVAARVYYARRFGLRYPAI